MNKEQKLSNSILVYGFVALSFLIYIFGFFAVIQFSTEASKIGVGQAIANNAFSTILGIICLLLVAPTYKLTRSLRILHLEVHQNGLVMLTFYEPLIINDFQQADRIVNIKNLKKVQQNDFFNSLVNLSFEENGVEQSIHSFVSPSSLAKLKTI